MTYNLIRVSKGRFFLHLFVHLGTHLCKLIFILICYLLFFLHRVSDQTSESECDWSNHPIFDLVGCGTQDVKK